ncbi:MAG: CdaR family protein [Acidobacteria bacterium]|nr:CdaR family protein [Acidobacteriota bacterium]
MRSWLTGNLLLKILSLALAIGIWLVVIGEEKLEFSFPAPLVLRGLPETMALAQMPIDQVVVRLRAPEALLRGLTAGDIGVRLDLTGLTPGEYLLPLRRDQVSIPFSAELLTVTPEVVPVIIEPKVLREIPVDVRVEGVPLEGIRIAGVEVEPSQVAVEGPEGAVLAVSVVSTERVSIGDRRESFETQVNVLSGNPLLRVVGDTVVTVKVDLTSEPGR